MCLEVSVAQLSPARMVPQHQRGSWNRWPLQLADGKDQMGRVSLEVSELSSPSSSRLHFKPLLQANLGNATQRHAEVWGSKHCHPRSPSLWG